MPSFIIINNKLIFCPYLYINIPIKPQKKVEKLDNNSDDVVIKGKKGQIMTEQKGRWTKYKRAKHDRAKGQTE